jgi:hypothetical protein
MKLSPPLYFQWICLRDSHCLLWLPHPPPAVIVSSTDCSWLSWRHSSYSIQMFSFHRLIHVKVKYFSRNTLHAFLPSNIGGKVFRVRREGLWLYVDDVPSLQFTLLWVPPEFPRGIPGAYNSSIAVVERQGEGTYCAVMWTDLIHLSLLSGFILFFHINPHNSMSCRP